MQINQGHNITFGQQSDQGGPEMTLQQQIRSKLSALVALSDQAIPEFGPFTPHVKTFDNPEPDELQAGNIELELGAFEDDGHPDSRSQRYLKVRVYTPSGLSNASQMIIFGTKSELLSQIKAEEAVSLAEQGVRELAASLSEKDHA